jgi:hypothetical protein
MQALALVLAGAGSVAAAAVAYRRRRIASDAAARVLAFAAHGRGATVRERPARESGYAERLASQRIATTSSSHWRERVQEILLASGIAAALLYVATDVFASFSADEYSYRDQHISELMARGASTRPVVVPLMTVTSLLLGAFAVGIWRSPIRKRSLRILAISLAASVLVGALVALFSPMHQRGEESSLTDTMHAVGTATEVVLILIAMGFGAAAFGKRFRLYSIATIAVLVVFGVWAASSGADVAADQATPWMGVVERVNIYGYQLWVAVLAIMLLREWRTRESRRLAL